MESKVVELSIANNLDYITTALSKMETAVRHGLRTSRTKSEMAEDFDTIYMQILEIKKRTGIFR